MIDIGGGRFDTAIEAAMAYDASVVIYDPYNRSTRHNDKVLATEYDVAVVSNVLNVIDSSVARKDVLELAARKAPVILVTVYEGDGSGFGRQTGNDSWQENRRTCDYMDEISATLPDWVVNRYGRLIVAKKWVE